MVALGFSFGGLSNFFSKTRPSGLLLVIKGFAISSFSAISPIRLSISNKSSPASWPSFKVALR